jgi:hypothetical protein
VAGLWSGVVRYCLQIQKFRRQGTYLIETVAIPGGIVPNKVDAIQGEAVPTVGFLDNVFPGVQPYYNIILVRYSVGFLGALGSCR